MSYGEDFIRSLYAVFYDIGDDRLDPSWNPEWFDAGVHGNSFERSQAQGVGYASGNPEYCQAYEDWADRPATSLGAGVSLRRPPGTSVRVIPDDMHVRDAGCQSERMVGLGAIRRSDGGRA